MAHLPHTFLLILVFSYSSCTYSQTKSAWANFDYELSSDDLIMVLPDSVVIPYLDSYEAIISFDDDYFYLKNRDDMFMYVYILSNDLHDMMSSHIVYNSDNYFIYLRNWSYDNDEWLIRVRRFGDEILADADCIGYDSESLLIVINDYRYLYDYNFDPLTNDSELECVVYP